MGNDTTIKEILERILLMSEEDTSHVLYGVTENYIRTSTSLLVKDIMLDRLGKTRKMTYDLGDKGMEIKLPFDCLKVIDLFSLSSSGGLIYMFRNLTSNVSYNYLLDDSGSLLSDDDNNLLLGRADTPQRTSFNTRSRGGGRGLGNAEGLGVFAGFFVSQFYDSLGRFTGGVHGFQGGTRSFGGQYSYDDTQGIIVVQDVPSPRRVVIMYIIDPATEGFDDIKIPASFENAFHNGVLYFCCKDRKIGISEQRQLEVNYRREMTNATWREMGGASFIKQLADINKGIKGIY